MEEIIGFALLLDIEPLWYSICLWILYKCFFKIKNLLWNVAILISAEILVSAKNFKFAQKMIG